MEVNEKDKNNIHKFWIRIVDVLVIICAIFVYNCVTLSRQKAADEDKYKADLQSVKNSAEAEIAEAKQAAAIAATESETENNNYKDGTYTGEAKGYGGPIKVKVTVKDGKITKVKVTSHKNEDDAYYSQAEAVIDKIEEAGNTDVDTVSGATFSSTGIINAVNNALQGR